MELIKATGGGRGGACLARAGLGRRLGLAPHGQVKRGGRAAQGGRSRVGLMRQKGGQVKRGREAKQGDKRQRPERKRAEEEREREREKEEERWTLRVRLFACERASEPGRISGEKQVTSAESKSSARLVDCVCLVGWAAGWRAGWLAGWLAG